MNSVGDVRMEGVPDPTIVQPTDALLRIRRTRLCGSDLHAYHQMEATQDSAPDDVPAGHRAMDDREALKVLVQP